MDQTVQQKLSKFCPDLLELFSDLLPSNLTLIELDDRWIETREFHDQRDRSFRFILSNDQESLSELFEDVIVNASGDGWTIVDEEDENRAIFENQDSTLTVELDRYQSEPAIRIDLEQTWASDVHPPVQTSELFVEACQNIIQVHDFPIHLRKDICFDLSSPELIRTCFEEIRYRFDRDINDHLFRSGYSRSSSTSDRWNQSSLEGRYRYQANIKIDSAQKLINYSLLTVDQTLSIVK